MLPFSEGLAEVFFLAGIGLYRQRREYCYKTKFDLIYPFSEGLALVNVDIFGDKACGYIDRTGNFVIKPPFDYAENFPKVWP